MEMEKILIFLDRDGTLTYDDDFYLGSQKDWKEKIQFLPNVLNWLQKIAEYNKKYQNKILTIIVTNQSGCAFLETEKKYINEKDLKIINNYIEEEIKKNGGKIDLTVYSPYISEKSAEKYKNRWIWLKSEKIIDSPLTKPNIGMMEMAMKYFSLNREDCQCFMIGDRISDMEFGYNINSKKNFLILSNKTEKNWQDFQKYNFEKVEDFWLAIEKILNILIKN